MKKENGYEIEARQISFTKMLGCIVKKWRFLLICALICAVASGVYRYQSDYRANKAAYEASLHEEEQQQVTVEELMEELNEDQIAGIYRAIYYQKRADVTAEYLDHSILLHADPYAKNIYEITYPLTGEETASQAVLVQQAIFDVDFFQSLIDKLGWDTQTQHMWELFDSAYENEQLVITVTADTMENASALKDATMELVEAQFSELKGTGYAIADCVVDYSLVTRYNEMYDYSVISSENYMNYMYHFNDTQKRVFYMLTEEAVAEEPVEKPAPVLNPTHLNKKMVVFGAVAGLVLGLVILGIWYTFNGNVHGVEEISYQFAEPVLGILSTGHSRKEQRKFESQLSMLVSNVYLSCKRRDINRIYLTGSRMDKLSKTFTQELQSLLKEKGITLVIGKSIISDADALLEAVEYPAILLAEVDEASKCQEIAKELNLCLAHQMVSLGIIMVQK